MRAAQAVGRYGERVAEAHLVADGMVVLARNWRFRSPELVGELDLVAVDGSCLVVAEVKTRRSLNCGVPTESITAGKLRRLRRLAGAWLGEYHGADAPPSHEVRIDILAVTCLPRGAAEVQHLRGVG